MNTQDITTERNIVLDKMMRICPPGANRRSARTHEQILTEYIQITTEAIKLSVGQSNKELRAQGYLELDCTGIYNKLQYKFINHKTGARTRWLAWLQQHYPLYSEHKRANYKNRQRKLVVPLMEKIMPELTEYLSPESAQARFEKNIQPLLDRYQAGDHTALEEITTVPINVRGVHNARAYYRSELLKQTQPEDQLRLYSYIQACDQVLGTCEASVRAVLGDPGACDATGYYSEMLVKTETSDWGRIYHLGISPQTLPRDIRRACIAPCWQYDVQTSVFAFYAYLNTLLTPLGLQIQMPHTQALVQDRKLIRESLAAECLSNIQVSPEYKLDMIKRSLTAISFGARITGADCWPEPGSDPDKPRYGQSALRGIILNKESRERFRDHWLVQGISSEIAQLGQIVCENYEQIMGVEPGPELLNNRGRVRASKALSYMYQHFETVFMQDLIDTCVIPETDIILRVHDAIYLRKQIGNQDLLAKFQRKYAGIFRVSPEKLEPYSSQDTAATEHNHSEFIQAEERLARQTQKTRSEYFQTTAEIIPFSPAQGEADRKLRALRTLGVSMAEITALDPDYAAGLAEADQRQIQIQITGLLREKLRNSEYSDADPDDDDDDDAEAPRYHQKLW